MSLSVYWLEKFMIFYTWEKQATEYYDYILLISANIYFCTYVHTKSSEVIKQKLLTLLTTDYTLYFIFILKVKEYLLKQTLAHWLIYLSIPIFTEHSVDASLWARWYKFINEQDTINKEINNYNSVTQVLTIVYTDTLKAWISIS